jgi:hypothetical protein
MTNEPLAVVFAKGIAKEKRGKTLFLISKAPSLIFCVVFLIEVVAPLINRDAYLIRQAAEKVSLVAELIRKAT